MNYDILALCSGGFDSIVMLNQIGVEMPEKRVLVLHFNYSQKNCRQELIKTKQVCDKFNMDLKVVSLPKFDWTQGDFYKEGFSGENKEYLEMRNMVFISYALSICESYKIPYMYMATLKSLGYYDTSEAFLSKVRGIALDKGITLNTPFSEYSKFELTPLAFYYSVKKDDFFTCDNPVNGEPCGKCPDCINIDSMFEDIDTKIPIQSWVKHFDPSNSEFIELFKKSPIDEIRLLINNDCQLNCSHCYYGFKDMVSERMKLDEYLSIFEQAKKLGINSFHYSGKEPLYDDFIFVLNKELRKIIPDAVCSVVTNGINVPKYIEQLKDGNFIVCVSVDEIEETSLVRTSKNVAYKAINSLVESDIPYQIFIDLHSNNYGHIDKILEFLYSKYNTTYFYLRNIVSIGNASNDDFPKLSVEQMNTAYVLAKKFAENHKDVQIAYNMGVEHTYKVWLGDDCELRKDIDTVFSYANGFILDNLYLHPEAYCGKYETQITITPDGYVHGCASEVSCKCYDKISPGNIREYSLQDLIAKGKQLAIQTNLNEIDKDGKIKFFNCTCCKPIDNN